MGPYSDTGQMEKFVLANGLWILATFANSPVRLALPAVPLSDRRRKSGGGALGDACGRPRCKPVHGCRGIVRTEALCMADGAGMAAARGDREQA